MKKRIMKKSLPKNILNKTVFSSLNNKKIIKDYNLYNIKNKYKDIRFNYNITKIKFKKNKRLKDEKKKKKNMYLEISNIKTKINFFKSENKNLTINKTKNINLFYKKSINKKLKTHNLNKNENVIKIHNKMNIQKEMIYKINSKQQEILMILKNLDKNEIIKSNNIKLLLIKKVYNNYFKKLKNRKNYFPKDYFIKNKMIIKINEMIIKNKQILINRRINFDLFKEKIIKKNNEINELNEGKIKNNLNLKKLKSQQKSILKNKLYLKIKNLDNENEKIIKDIKEKDIELNEKEKKIEEEKSRLEDEFNSIFILKNEIKIKLKNILIKNKSTWYKIINNNNNDIKSTRIENYNNIKEKVKEKVKTVRLIKKLEFNDIEAIIKKLKFKLLLKGFNTNIIISYLIKNNKEIITIQDLIQKFNKKPFNIKSYDDCVLLSRFLIEDNNKEYIEYSEDKSNSVFVVKSILKNLFDPMDFPIKLDFNKIHKKLSIIFHKEFDKFILFKNLHEKGIYIDFKDLLFFYKKLNYSLSIKEINYMEVSLYYLFKKSFKINFNNLKNLFLPKNYSNLNDIYQKKKDQLHIEKNQSNFTYIVNVKDNSSKKFKRFQKKNSLLYDNTKEKKPQNLLLNL